MCAGTDAVSKIGSFRKFGWVLGLERMNVLLEKLGNPHENLKVIHVAGTNGKGSICRYIYEVLQTAGYHCGLFTSPYLEVFNERIEYDGSYITDEELQQCSEIVLAKTEEMVGEGCDSPTEFEVITAIAFLYFQRKKTDYVVLEVGLGGRGDSTNVVKEPLVSVIASISLDHTDRLGETIAQIAGEKAGIIKAGCPVVTSTERPEAMEVFREKCAEMSAPLYDSMENPYEILEENLETTRFTVDILQETFEMEISMLGKHQVQNAAAALTALVLLNRQHKISVSRQDLETGMKRAKQIGRFEVMRTDPYVIIDGAHNPDGSKVLKEAVKRRFAGKRILLATGILADKEVSRVLDNFLEITSDFVATEPDNPRKLPAGELARQITEKGGRVVVKEKPADAVEYIKEKYGEYDLILFTGSLYLIGTIRGMLNEKDAE